MRARGRVHDGRTDTELSVRRTSALSAVLGRLFLAAALTSVCVPAPALAKPPAGVQQFASAQKLYDAGDYGAALPLFRQVLESSGSPNARLYVARCLRELGRLPEAYEEMDITQRDAATRAESEPKYAQTRDAAAAERAILESRVGRLIVAIADPPDDVRVTVNDQPLASERLGSPTTVSPGTIVLEVEAPGSNKVERRVTIAAGETKTVALTLTGEKDETPQGLQKPQQPSTAQPTGGGVRTAGYFVAGLGAAGLALFGVTWLQAGNQHELQKDECGRASCSPARYDEIVAKGKTLDTLATVGLIGGITGVAAGTAMIVFGGPSTPDAPTTARVTVSPGWASLSCTVDF
jgi:Tetratricopeptide repeat